MKAVLKYRRYLENMGWLLLDRVLRMGVNLFIVGWVARYLKPEGFGTMQYVIALVYMAGSISSLGIDRLVVRDYVRYPHRKADFLATALRMRIYSGFGVGLIALAASVILDWDQPDVIGYVLLMSLSYLPIAFDVIEWYFESQTQSRYSVLAKSGAFLLTSLFRVFLLLTHQPLVFFIGSYVLEYMLGALFLWIQFRRLGKLHTGGSWRPKNARLWLRQSWPLLLGNVMVLLYMRIDTVMVKEMLDNTSVGLYSAAVKLSELSFAIPVLIMNSIGPRLVQLHKENPTLYHERLRQVYLLMIGLTLMYALAARLLGPWLVPTLFGADFASANDIWQIHSWSLLFVSLGVVSAQYMIMEGGTRLMFYGTVLGGATNFLLNLIFIPWLGGAGAAWASVISFAMSPFGVLWLNAKGRVVYQDMLLALSPGQWRKWVQQL